MAARRLTARRAWWLAAGAAAALWLAAGAAAAVETIDIAFLKKETEKLPKLSNLDPPPADDGALGGKQGIIDNNTTGKFLGHEYRLETVVLAEDGDAGAALRELHARGVRQFIVDVAGGELLALADSGAGRESWFYNVGAGDDTLRTTQCRRNILHIAPSHSMRADALAQYLIARKWPRWFLVSGRRGSDLGFAAAVRRAAKKFGGKIAADKQWEYGPDMRRTAASTVPVFTQDAEYDVLIVADVVGEFGEYLAYRTWKPRPVAGTQGLAPVTWHRAHEQWGAVQIQNRFLKNHGRRMSEKDYGVWSAVRVIGEAVTRGGSTGHAQIADYIRGDAFELAGYKGQKMSFRKWNLQLRQPILLVSPTSLVSVSPQRQFLHQRSVLDTMGYDRPESQCRLDETP